MSGRIEKIILEDSHTSFEALRRNHEVIFQAPRPGEQTYRALGEYAIAQPSEEPWQLLPAFQQQVHSTGTTEWANAEELRTAAGYGTFLAHHMDLIETALYHKHRRATPENRIIVMDEPALRYLLESYNIDTSTWGEQGMRKLFDDLAHAGVHETENITLHIINNRPWLATSQTMLNVYYTEGGKTWKLRQVGQIYYDEWGNPQTPVESKIRSSMGETGHLIGDIPERPFDTARRGLLEELDIVQDSDILAIISTGSLLRQKEEHHHYPQLGAEDTTHYFNVWLNPHTVQRAGYTNIERDASGQPQVKIRLEWEPAAPPAP